MRKEFTRALAAIALGISALGAIGTQAANASTSINSTSRSNINGNLQVGGQFDLKGYWVYYFDQNDSYLRKMAIDGTKWSDLVKVDSGATNIIADGDWVYYICSGGIDRVHADGSGSPQVLYQPQPNENVTFTITGNWIIYNRSYNDANNNPVGQIDKMNLDGSQKKVVLKNGSDSQYIQTDGTWIYYEHIVDTDHNGFILNKIRLDGTGKRVVSKDVLHGWAIIYNNALYLQESNYQIFKMNTDGTKKAKLPISGILMNVGDNSIVYSPRPMVATLVRTSDLNGHNVRSTGLTGQPTVYLLGGWLFYPSTSTLYSNENMSWGIYKCKPDGTLNQELQKDGLGFKRVHVVWN